LGKLDGRIDCFRRDLFLLHYFHDTLVRSKSQGFVMVRIHRNDVLQQIHDRLDRVAGPALVEIYKHAFPEKSPLTHVEDIWFEQGEVTNEEVIPNPDDQWVPVKRCPI
jgi:hypothetical protein